MSKSQSQSIPPQIMESLNAVIRRIRSIIFARGVLAVLGAALVSLVVIMCIDWAFDLEHKALRLLLTVSGLVVTLVTAWQYLLKPLARRLAYPTVARWLEQHHPEIQERISTAISLSKSDQGVPQGFVKQLLDQATADAAKIDPKKELTAKAARKPLWTAGIGGLALLALFIAAPSVFPVLFRRAVTPLADRGNIHSAAVRFLTADGQTVAMNDAFAVEAAYKASRDQRAVIVLTYPDGTEVREQMSEDGSLTTTQVDERGIRYPLPTQAREPEAKK